MRMNEIGSTGTYRQTDLRSTKYLISDMCELEKNFAYNVTNGLHLILKKGKDQLNSGRITN